MRASGFTLLELLAVIAIIAIIGSTAIILLPGREARFNGAVKAVSGKVLLGRSLAASKGRQIAVKAEKTPRGLWKVTVIDSNDNVLGNQDDTMADAKPYYLPKQIVLDKIVMLVYQPDGSITDTSDTAITLIDSSERGSTWKKTLRVSRNAGTVTAGELVKEQTGNTEN